MIGIFRSNNKRRKFKRKASQGKVKRFLKTVVLSAAVSFAATSWALHPQLFSSPQQYLQHLELSKIELPQISSGEWSLPSIQLGDFSLRDAGLRLVRWVGIENVLAWLDQERSLAAFDTQHTGQVAGSASVAASEHYVQTQFNQCPHFFPKHHYPIVPAQDALRELCFTPFAILHSGQNKTPVFVAQRLNRQMLQQAQNIKRNDRFYEEARLPRAERASLEDYRGSGYDRGHMAPAGDMHNAEAMAQSFSLSNIVPQDSTHNRGAWNKIEQDTRKYIMRAAGDVYVFTGPVYSDNPPTIGARKVAIPSYLFKVVYDETTGKAWVHWHENSAQARAGAPISYAEFVRRTGLHLLDPSLLNDPTFTN